MDAQARKKALYRAKLSANKLEKRIESPLVRYNEFDQPVCRVCDVVLKSESLWPAHQASRKHHEAINNVKANAAGLARVSNIKTESPVELPRPKSGHSSELHDSRPEVSMELTKARSSSVLPPDFFDNNETKRPKADVTTMGNPDTYKKEGGSVQTQVAEAINSESKAEAFSSGKVVDRKINQSQPTGEHKQTSKVIVSAETTQSKGALPAGFFDDKDADLRARGITPVKPDVKDEYREFEKLIKDDLQEVDNRLEEEEIDAAEMIEEAESVEQKGYRARVELLKKKKMELIAARSVPHRRDPQVASKGSDHEESSSDDGSDENFTVDWRAKHL
ncbi:protein ABA AND ROS SENSITIVE 1 isoform X2 [Diospyros lotus]|nr:protein ABA AND ROS SENSITIVE 1 isoform X2 [Diospyros lotus]XP_052194024.1 protein ABA AND ROS SENSITIVE 1 isoform X2 [Diospyros lotus]